MSRSRLERLEEAKRRGGGPPIETDLEGLIRLLVAGHKPVSERKINPTQRAFLYDSTPLKAYMGPAGVAKTSTGVCAGLLRALLCPGSFGLIARADYNDLLGTTMKTAEEMLQNLPPGVLVKRNRAPPERWLLQPVYPDAPLSEIYFMGLKDNIGGYKFNWALIDEADEAERKRILEVDTRLRAQDAWGMNDKQLMLCFNPPPKEHWLYTACTGMDFRERKIEEPIFKLFVAMPHENNDNLPDGYHEQLRKSLPEDMRVRLVEGQWGAVFPGKPVYPQFSYKVHTTYDVPYDEFGNLYRFWDFGFHRPYVCWAQMDYHGRLNVIHELMGENIEVKPFATRALAEQALRFPGHNSPDAYVIDYGDPAARQKKDTGSTLVELTKLGITMRWRIGSIDDGLQVVRGKLESMIDGKPALNLDRRYCAILISALRGGYRYQEIKENTVNKTDIKPEKDGYYDHPADAFRYGLYNLFGGGMSTVGNLPDNISYGS